MSVELDNISNEINKNYLTELPIALLTIICTFVDIHDLIKLLLVHSIFSFITSNKVIFVNLFQATNKSVNQSNTIVTQHSHCNCNICICKTKCLHYYWKQYLFNFNIVDSLETFYSTTNKLNLDLDLHNRIVYNATWRIFYKCKLFLALSRTLSFQPLQKIEAINLYSINIESRMLNFYEKQIFSSIQIVPNGKNYTIMPINKNCSKFQLNTKKIFINKFIQRYFINIWAKYINWDKFVIAGSSVLACIINGIQTKEWLFELNHDVDLFAININYVEFQREIINFQRHLQDIIISVSKTKYVSTFCLFINNEYIHIQFIWLCRYFNIDSILQNFDMDLVQCSFNPQKNIIKTSFAFIQFINTGYATIYSLLNSKSIINIKSKSRLIKYINRGFHNWLVPKKLNLNILKQSLNEQISQTQHFVVNSYGFINWTNDSCGVQKHILQLL